MICLYSNNCEHTSQDGKAQTTVIALISRYF